MPEESNVSVQQENYLKFYNHALYCFNNDRVDEGRRSMICAADMLIRIGSKSDSQMEAIYVNKARQLLEKSCSVSSVLDNDYMNHIEDDIMGVSVNIKPCKPTKVTHEIDKVAGLDDVKLEIKRKIVYPIKYPGKYRKFKKAFGGGILLYGLPGTGKTMIARAIARDCNAKFIPISCSSLLSKWLGESENNLKQYFDEARRSPRAIIFFDEFEALGAKRSGTIDNAMNRIVPELLQQMQGLEEHKESNIVVIGATNRPWDIDSAFLRSGRFGSKIYVNLPNESDRRQIIEQALVEVPQEADMMIDSIVKSTEGYNGADVFELCELAKVYAIEREIESGKPTVLTNQDLELATKAIHSSVQKDDLENMLQYLDANSVKSNVA